MSPPSAKGSCAGIQKNALAACRSEFCPCELIDRSDTQVANGVLRTDYARGTTQIITSCTPGRLLWRGPGLRGLALPGDGFGHEGRIEAGVIQTLTLVMIAIFTTILRFSRSWRTSFKLRRIVPVMPLQLGRRCTVSSGGFEDQDPFIAI